MLFLAMFTILLKSILADGLQRDYGKFGSENIGSTWEDPTIYLQDASHLLHSPQ